MTKVAVDLTIENIEDRRFQKVGSDNKWFIVSFSGRYWEVSEYTAKGPIWTSRELTKADVKARYALFKSMFNRHEDALRRKREEQGKRRIERKQG